MVSRFNREGIAAIEVRHGGGPTPTYTAKERARERILKEARRKPDREIRRRRRKTVIEKWQRVNQMTH